ncbi:hypothetical protein RCL1_001350 [Eukaryota sp. TZLM3-RCL]
MNTVSENSRVCLIFDDHYFITDPIVKGAQIKLNKNERVKLETLLGLSYGTFVTTTRSGSSYVFNQCDAPLLPEWSLSIEAEEDKNNANIVDDCSAQALASSDIAKLRTTATSSSEIISTLVENSKTFTDKTVFAQNKYINRKKKKYERVYLIDRVTPAAVCFNILKKSPDRVLYMTPDALAYVTQLSGAGPSPYPLIVMDSIDGLLYGSIKRRSLDRDVYFCYTSRGARFHLSTLSEVAEPKLKFPVNILAEKESVGSRGLAVAVTPLEIPLIISIWHHLLVGSPFVIYCIDVSVLIPLRQLIKKHDAGILMTIRELNIVPMVFCPGISRPIMSYKIGQGSGDGFVLFGYKSGEFPINFRESGQNQGSEMSRNDEPALKIPRCEEEEVEQIQE